MEDDLHIHSAISTPYTSAPSSPGTGEPPPHSFIGGGFFYSAPTSPTHHHTLSSPSSISVLDGSGGSFEFEFTVRQESIAGGGPAPAGSMTSADELFLNGQIRPMKLSSHLQRPQDPPPLIETDAGGDGGDGGGGDLRSRDRSKSVRRRTRSMSPLRTNNAFQWLEDDESTEINEIKEKLEAAAEEDNENENDNEAPSSSGETSRSSSAGRNSKRWVFLKELLLYRSKSEGRNSSNPNPNPSSNRNYHKLWSALSFSPNSSKKPSDSDPVSSKSSSNSDPVSSKSLNSDPAISKSSDGIGRTTSKSTAKKAVNGLGKRRSAHEVHYAAKRAQAEEMRRKTYLPYRQGLLGGCLGFSSKGYGAMNGFARALNTVSSR